MEKRPLSAKPLREELPVPPLQSPQWEFAELFETAQTVQIRHYRVFPNGVSRQLQRPRVSTAEHRPWPAAASGLACLAQSSRASRRLQFPPRELSALERTTKSLLAGPPAPPSTPRNVSVSNPGLGRNVAACRGPRSYFGGSLASPRLWPVGHPWSWLLRASLPNSLTTPSPPPAKKKCKAVGLRAKFKLS